MLSRVESCASQGTCSIKKKRRKSKLYYSSKKALEKSRTKTTKKEFIFRGPSKLLDFGNLDVANITSVIDVVLQDVEEVEEVIIIDVNKAACATEVNVGPTPT